MENNKKIIPEMELGVIVYMYKEIKEQVQKSEQMISQLETLLQSYGYDINNDIENFNNKTR